MVQFLTRKGDKRVFVVKDGSNRRGSNQPPQELMSRQKPKLPQDVRDFISDEISRQRKEGRPQGQSIAIAFSKARKKFPRQAKKLELMRRSGQMSGHTTAARTRNLLVSIFGLAIALRILREFRTRRNNPTSSDKPKVIKSNQKLPSGFRNVVFKDKQGKTFNAVLPIGIVPDTTARIISKGGRIIRIES